MTASGATRRLRPFLGPVLPTPLLRLPRCTVHFQELGAGAPLLLLSANPGEAADWAAVMPALAAEYRVLALDWPGYGGSEIPADADRWTVLDYAAVLREFLTALDLPPVRLIGNSVGGNAAARFAAEAPDRVRASAGRAGRLHAAHPDHPRLLPPDG